MRFIGAVLAPALVLAGAAQGALLMRCGPTARMSCCCPKEKAAAPAAAWRAEKPKCCDTVAIPAGPAQGTQERASPIVQPPVLVALAGELLDLDGFVDRGRDVPRLDPPPGRRTILVTCALLI